MNSRSHMRHLTFSMPKNDVKRFMISVLSLVLLFPLLCRSFHISGIPVSPVQTLRVSMFMSFSRVVQFVLSSASVIGSWCFSMSVSMSSAVCLGSRLISRKKCCSLRIFEFGFAFPCILFAMSASSIDFASIAVQIIAVRQIALALFRCRFLCSLSAICVVFLWIMLVLSPGVPVEGF